MVWHSYRYDTWKRVMKYYDEGAFPYMEDNMEDLIPKKILAVDDNTANLTLLNGILSGLYKVYPVDSGATALKFLEKQRPDLILLDIEMPEMSGTDLFRIIKEDSKLADIPIIFLTAHNDSKGEAEAFRLGASDYIHKPINDVILLARVKMHLELASYRNADG